MYKIKHVEFHEDYSEPDHDIVEVSVRNWRKKFPGFSNEFLKCEPGDYSDMMYIHDSESIFSIYAYDGQVRIRRGYNKQYPVKGDLNKLKEFLEK